MGGAERKFTTRMRLAPSLHNSLLNLPSVGRWLVTPLVAKDKSCMFIGRWEKPFSYTANTKERGMARCGCGRKKGQVVAQCARSMLSRDSSCRENGVSKLPCQNRSGRQGPEGRKARGLKTAFFCQAPLLDADDCGGTGGLRTLLILRCVALSMGRVAGSTVLLAVSVARGERSEESKKMKGNLGYSECLAFL